MTNPFVQASRKTVKARIALEGPSGSGKTYTGLAIATALGSRVAVIDTEKGSASTYANEFDFDVLELGPPFDPARYVKAIHDAEEAGYDVILIDSLSHAWFDEGGVLDIVDKSAGQSGNKFAGWSKGTPAHNSLIGAVVRSPIHVIATMRTKTEYVQETSNGKTTIRKIGMAPIQRENVDYEFTIVGSISLEHVLTVTKSRFRSLQDETYRRPGKDLAAAILAELETGESSGTTEPNEPPPSVVPDQTEDGDVEGEGHATATDPEEGGPSEVETPTSGDLDAALEEARSQFAPGKSPKIADARIVAAAGHPLADLSAADLLALVAKHRELTGASA